MMNHKKSRRYWLTAMAGLLGSTALAKKVAAATLTPSAAEGPFYPKPSMRLADVDNDLVKVAGLVEEAGGEIITLRGTVVDQNGRPLSDHRVEIWQCDVNGKYLHTGDDRKVIYDKAFQGFGHDVTDATGGYVFRTIKPTIYPGRTPHIHVKVCKGERDLLTTQFYIKDHPDNKSDSLFKRMSDDQVEAVSMEFIASDHGTETSIDIVV